MVTMGYSVVDILGASEPRFTDGAVSALSGAGGGEDNFVQISVPVQPGNSGGPLINEAGQVVGVIAAGAALEPFLKATGDNSAEHQLGGEGRICRAIARQDGSDADAIAC